MTIETNNPKLSMKDRVVGWSKDLLTIIAALSILFSMAAVMFRPWIQPFMDLPQSLNQLSSSLAVLQSRVDGYGSPQLLNVQGIGQIIGNRNLPTEGGVLTVGYFLRRNASCETDIRIRFVDIERNQTIVTLTRPTNRAPVTASFIFFKVDIVVPEGFRPSVYAYHPEILPVDCGVYKPFSIAPSQYFTVGLPEDRHFK